MAMQVENSKAVPAHELISFGTVSMHSAIHLPTRSVLPTWLREKRVTLQSLMKYKNSDHSGKIYVPCQSVMSKRTTIFAGGDGLCSKFVTQPAMCVNVATW
jgi:hypothetical protein